MSELEARIAALPDKSLLLLDDDQARWNMRNPNGGIGRVDVLATRARGSVDVDLQIFLIDLNVDLFSFGKNGNSGRRCMNAPTALRRWHTLHAMNA